MIIRLTYRPDISPDEIRSTRSSSGKFLLVLPMSQYVVAITLKKEIHSNITFIVNLRRDITYSLGTEQLHKQFHIVGIGNKLSTLLLHIFMKHCNH
jgi:hypothetical protein